MNAETRPENLANYVPPTIAEKVMGKLLLRPASTLMSERILEHAKLEMPDEFLIEYVHAIDAGYVPILVANHSSHADAVTSAKLIKLLIKIANGALPADNQMQMFSFPLAASLDAGKQGPFLRQVYWGSKPVIENAGFVPNPIVRPKDQRSLEKGGYDMKGNLRDYLKRYKQRMKEGPNGTVLYPEGTTESGKTDENGLPIGMIPFEEDSISGHIRFTKKFTGRKIMLIYAGITGSTSAIDPNTKKVPLRAIDSMIHPDQYKIRVGGIIREDDPEFTQLTTNEEINNFMGRKIASLLPPNMRGVYA